jgi:hypothetical protein
LQAAQYSIVAGVITPRISLPLVDEGIIGSTTPYRRHLAAAEGIVDLIRYSLCRHLEVLTIELHRELDLSAAGLTLVRECPKRPLGRKRNFEAIDLAV